jgi:hypothetical protein
VEGEASPQQTPLEEALPISEVRRVVVEYEIGIPARSPRPSEPTRVPVAVLAEAIRKQLIRAGSRNPNVFGGRD